MKKRIKIDYLNYKEDAIQQAIDTLYELGGGTVVIPKGIYISKPIVLKSNVCIETKKGTLVIFEKRKEWYPLILTEFEGVKRIRTVSPISANSAKNISIIGKGVFDGDGFKWRPLKKFKVTEKFFNNTCLKISNDTIIPTKEGGIWYPTKSSYELAVAGDEPSPTKENIEKYKDNYDYFRPVFVSLVKCTDVLLDGPTFRNSPAWNIHPLFTNNLTIKNCYIYNESYAQNGDGLDIESCQNVLIKDNIISVGDDGICLKAGKNREARMTPIPTKKVVIKGNKVYNAHGGIVFGSEMSRSIIDVYCENNTFIGTDIGLRFKTQLGRGGVVSNITINDTYMHDILGEAIIMTCGYELYRMENESRDIVNEIAEDDYPEFKDITIENLYCTKANIGISLKGLKDKPIRNITFKNIDIKAKNALIEENVLNINYDNVNIVEE